MTTPVPTMQPVRHLQQRHPGKSSAALPQHPSRGCTEGCTPQTLADTAMHLEVLEVAEVGETLG
jgi:hypothetical protein